jgi:hypothetical protein
MTTVTTTIKMMLDAGQNIEAKIFFCRKKDDVGARGRIRNLKRHRHQDDQRAGNADLERTRETPREWIYKIGDQA